MTFRRDPSVWVRTATITVLVIPLIAEARGPSSVREPASTWKPPRTSDGKPDLQGNWSNATITPLQRPPELANKAYFSQEEAAAYQRQRLETLDVDRPGGPRDLERSAYNSLFAEPGTVVKTLRTSLIIDPPDGQIPPFTEDARRRHERVRAASASHPADSPEDRWLTERCILFGGGGPPMLPEPYSSNYQIVQSSGYVAIRTELNHEIRIIPTDTRSHPQPQLRQWTGYSTGHWDGDTLVIETTNFKDNGQSRFGVSWLDGMTDPNLRIVERLTLTDAATILYQAFIDDPTVFITPWTIEIPFHRLRAPLFEYACHEGNHGLAFILSGARADETRVRQ
jgi:hypothetical protein